MLRKCKPVSHRCGGTEAVKAGLPGRDWSQTVELGCVGAECWAVIDCGSVDCVLEQPLREQGMVDLSLG